MITKEKILRNWVKKLAAQSEQGEIAKITGQFDLSELLTSRDDLDTLFKTMDEAVKQFDPKLYPYFLDALYTSDNHDKLILFCYLLDTTCEDLAFITNLENHDIYEEKFKMILPALLSVIERCWNGIGDCMYLILLKAAKNKDLFGADDISRIIKAATGEAEAILNWVDDTNPAPEEIPVSLEIIMDVARYFHDGTLLDLAERAFVFENNSLKIFAALALMAGGREVSRAGLEPAAADLKTADMLLKQLESIDRPDLFPAKYAAQEHIAMSNLCNWLVYPMELGALPDEIELVSTFENDGQLFYVFKFRSEKEDWIEKGWMAGLSGGFDKKKPLCSGASAGYTFSMFETLEGDGIAQGEKIMNLIADLWKQRAEEIEAEREAARAEG